MECDAVQCGRQEKPVTSIFCEHSYAISSYLTNPARSIYILLSERVSQRSALENRRTKENMKEKTETKKPVNDNVTTT